MTGEDTMTRPALTRRRFVGSGAFALGAAALPFSPRPLSAQTPVGLQLSWLHSSQFAGSYIALERGWWSEAGLDVSLMPGGPNAPVEPPRRVGQRARRHLGGRLHRGRRRGGRAVQNSRRRHAEEPFRRRVAAREPGERAGRPRGQAHRHGAGQHAGPAGALHAQRCRHR